MGSAGLFVQTPPSGNLVGYVFAMDSNEFVCNRATNYCVPLKQRKMVSP